jgi:hypothetical protein
VITNAVVIPLLNHVKAYNTMDAKFNSPRTFATLRDPKTFFFTFLNVGNTLAISSVGLFLPTFINAFGYSSGNVSGRMP